MSISLVAHNAAASGNGTSVTTVGVDTSGANLLTAVTVSLHSGGTISSVTDSYGNTWTKLNTYGGIALDVSIWYSSPTSVGTGHTFTATGSGSVFPAFAIAAFSGAASSSVFDVQNGNNGGSSTTIAPGSITPANANELIISGYVTNASVPSGIDSGFTITDSVAPGGNNYGVALAYLIQTSAAAVNPTWTTSGGGFLSASIASFNASGGAPPAGGLFLPAALNGLGAGGPFFRNPLD